MIDWFMFRDWLSFWLPPIVGIAAALFLMALTFKIMFTIRRERQVSSDVTRAYKYFKRILERQNEEDQN